MNTAQKLYQDDRDSRGKRADFQRHIRTTEKAFDALIKMHSRHTEERQEAYNAKGVVMAKLEADMPKVRKLADGEEFIAYLSLYGGELPMAGIKEDYPDKFAKAITKRLLRSGDLVSRKSNSGATTYYKLAPKWLETANA